MATKTSGLSGPAKAALAGLKAEIEAGKDKVFEAMSADLFSKLIDVPVYVAKTGFQFGADAGTSGLRGRRLRLECKRYKETTRLDARGLAGEVMQAVERDKLLEAWVLMSTKSVSDTERNGALAAGEELGVATIVLDWTIPPAGSGICSVAALCATWPDIVEFHLGKVASAFARGLTPEVGGAIDSLRKDLEVWSIGFRNIRQSSIERLLQVWRNPESALACLNQDAAGGNPAVLHLLSRATPLKLLEEWWDKAKVKSAGVVTGLEGVGKTWVALDWATRNADELPIVILIPANAFVNDFTTSEAGLPDILIQYLRTASGSGKSEDYWKARLGRLLQRPEAEGPAFLMIVDGINQQPQVPWQTLVQTIQGNSFGGRIRLLFTSRKTYFEDDLRRFGKLGTANTEISVGPYDQAELDELLKAHGMARSDMHPSLHALAAMPRLFPLVVKLKDNVALQSEASVHRLLFEYGKDVLQQRQGSTLTDDKWVDWLVERAKQYREQIPATKALASPLTYKEVGDTVANPVLSSSEVARRLSEVIDGRLFEEVKVGITKKFILRRDGAILALAVALLDILHALHSPDLARVRASLDAWLEPVAAIDEVSEVLRAALAVSSAIDGVDGQPVVDGLLVTWMQAQNPTKNYGRDVDFLGAEFPRSMLAVIEHSGRSSHAGALHYATQAIRSLSLARKEDWQFVVKRMERWAGWIKVPLPEQASQEGHYARHDYKRLIERISTADPKEMVVLGVPLNLAYQHVGDPSASIPGILEGHSLSDFSGVLLAAAVRWAVLPDSWSRCWPGLAWLAFIGSSNEVETRSCLRTLSEEVQKLTPEVGVNPRLARHVAALLLRLSQDETSEKDAQLVDERFDVAWNYKSDYLDSPGESFFTLERRHLENVVTDATLPIARRLSKLKSFLPDPTVSMPSDLLQHVRERLEAETFEGIDAGAQRTAEEFRFAELEEVAARFLPDVHAETTRRRLLALSQRNGEEKYWASLRAHQFLLAAGPAECDRFSGLRTRTVLASHERIANCLALQLELLHKDLHEQLNILVQAPTTYHTMDLLAVVRQASGSQVAKFLSEHGAENRTAVRIALEVLAFQIPSGIDEIVPQLLQYLKDDDSEMRTTAFVALSLAAPNAMGQELIATNWRPVLPRSVEAHYGSTAVISASSHLNFKDVVPMLAPWRLFDAVVQRGGHPDEFIVATKHVIGLMNGPAGAMPVLNGDVSLGMPEAGDLGRIKVSMPQSVDQLDTLKSFAEPPEIREKRMQEFAKESGENIDRIRGDGFAFFLQIFSTNSVRAAWRGAPKEWLLALDGAQGLTSEFTTRVRSAEGLFLAMCEVLLEEEPARGAILWRALRSCLLTRFVGVAGISELEHMLFRVSGSHAVLELRAELASLAYTNTDKALLELVIAAQVNGCEEWLTKLVIADEASPQTWRNKRAIMLAALLEYPSVDALKWPEGEWAGSWKWLRERMLGWTNRGALARHWWHKFITAGTADAAFSAWQVFLQCGDRRSHIWMNAMSKSVRTDSEFDRLRKLHVRLNRDRLESAFAQHEDKSPKFVEKFLGADAPKEWLELDGVVKT